MTCLRSLCPTLAALAVPAALLSAVASADTLTWDAGGGAANSFNEPLNWVGEVPFTNGDDIVFSAPGTPGGTALVLDASTLNSVTFNADADNNTVLGTSGATGEITLNTGITVQSGSDGQHRIDARLTLHNNVDFVNNTAQPFRTNIRGQDGASPGGITFYGEQFLEGGRNANNTFTGGFTIARGTVQVRSEIVDVAARGTFGLGDVNLGLTGSADSATLLINAGAANDISRPLNVASGTGDRTLALAPPASGIRTVRWAGDITLDNTLNVRVAGFNEPFRAGFLWLNGTISGTGDLKLFNAGGTDGSLVVMANPNGDNTFTGTVHVDTAVQLRDGNALGNAANRVVVGGNNANGDGDVIAFIERAAANNAVLSRTIAQDIDLISGSVQVAADFNVFEPVTGIYHGNIAIGETADVAFNAAASNSTNAAGGTQDLTLELSGDITGGNPQGVASFTGGNGTGTVTGTSNIILRGNSDYLHATSIEAQNGGSLTVTLDGGRLAVNNNVSIGLGATLQGDANNAGTLAFNLLDGATITTDGTLDITHLTLDLDTTGFTGTDYVLANYASGTLLGSEFSAIAGLSGFTIDYLTNSQITLNRILAGLAGDYNDSGSVEQGDLDLVLNNWGGPRTAGFVANADGFATANVDQEELDRVLNNWGSSSAPSFNGFAVPEPTAALALAGLALVGRRRNR